MPFSRGAFSKTRFIRERFDDTKDVAFEIWAEDDILVKEVTYIR